MSDDLAAAAADLSMLPGADRQAILAGLRPDERARVHAAMRRGPLPARAAPPPHSPWFERLLDAADVTPAARAALAAFAVRTGDEEPRLPGRTLIQATGGLLAKAVLRR